MMFECFINYLSFLLNKFCLFTQIFYFFPRTHSCEFFLPIMLLVWSSYMIFVWLPIILISLFKKIINYFYFFLGNWFWKHWIFKFPCYFFSLSFLRWRVRTIRRTWSGSLRLSCSWFMLYILYSRRSFSFWLSFIFNHVKRKCMNLSSNFLNFFLFLWRHNRFLCFFY